MSQNDVYTTYNANNEHVNPQRINNNVLFFCKTKLTFHFILPLKCIVFNSSQRPKFLYRVHSFVQMGTDVRNLLNKAAQHDTPHTPDNSHHFYFPHITLYLPFIPVILWLLHPTHSTYTVCPKSTPYAQLSFVYFGNPQKEVYHIVRP